MKKKVLPISYHPEINYLKMKLSSKFSMHCLLGKEQWTLSIVVIGTILFKVFSTEEAPEKTSLPMSLENRAIFSVKT